MHQLFVDSLPGLGQIVNLGGSEAHYVGRALRARPGERFRLADAGGRAAVALLEGFSGGELRLLVEAEDPDPQPAFSLALDLCPPRGEALEQALEQAAQFGVVRVALLRSERTLVDLGPGGFRRERWERRLREACRQCRRARVPVLEEPRPLAEALADVGGGRRLLLSERGGVPLVQAVAGATVGAAFRLLVGPEGGFSAAEHDRARACGWIAVSLGPHPLRTPTAVAAVLAALRAFEPA